MFVNPELVLCWGKFLLMDWLYFLKLHKYSYFLRKYKKHKFYN